MDSDLSLPAAGQAQDCVAGDAGYRALEGLVPLYAATHDPEVLALCKASAAYAFAWTYFYDIPAPKTHNGIARGGQCCCNHFPLIFVIGPEMGVEPLLQLAKLSGDPLYQQMAGEMTSYIANSQVASTRQALERRLAPCLRAERRQVLGTELRWVGRYRHVHRQRPGRHRGVAGT